MIFLSACLKEFAPASITTIIIQRVLIFTLWYVVFLTNENFRNCSCDDLKSDYLNTLFQVFRAFLCSRTMNAVKIAQIQKSCAYYQMYFVFWTIIVSCVRSELICSFNDDVAIPFLVMFSHDTVLLILYFYWKIWKSIAYEIKVFIAYEIKVFMSCL